MCWVAVVLAVLQLCTPALQADPSLTYQLQDGQEKPGEFHDYAASLSNLKHKYRADYKRGYSTSNVES